MVELVLADTSNSIPTEQSLPDMASGTEKVWHYEQVGPMALCRVSLIKLGPNNYWSFYRKASKKWHFYLYEKRRQKTLYFLILEKNSQKN